MKPIDPILESDPISRHLLIPNFRSPNFLLPHATQLLNFCQRYMAAIMVHGISEFLGSLEEDRRKCNHFYSELTTSLRVNRRSPSTSALMKIGTDWTWMLAMSNPPKMEANLTRKITPLKNMQFAVWSIVIDRT